MQYIKKPIPVEATQIPNAGWDTRAFVEWLKQHDPNGKAKICKSDANGVLTIQIKTLEGVMEAKTGDYLLKGGEDEFWFNQKHLFEERYELFGDDTEL